MLTIDKYKARLVVKRFEQQEGVNYFDIYSLVLRITSIWVFIVFVTIKKLKMYQIDVKVTFLNADFDNDVYIEHPEGFMIKGKENKVCKLVKSLYDLKQTLNNGMKILINLCC